MKTTGIICEFNPLHLGHAKLLRLARTHVGEGGGVVCLMSGNFVQRGAPAIFDKSLRAEAALRCGADLVLELPVTGSLSSAEGFAAEGVRILSGFCDFLSFGAESGDADALLDTAARLLATDFPEKLRVYLDQGLSFPAARQAALGSDLLSSPNDILGVEYCKAILSQNAAMQPHVIRRFGSYHDTAPDPENPSATALRGLLGENADWLLYVPEAAHACFQNATVHTLEQGEKAVLARLRTMTEAEFSRLPHGSEGLWRKFMHAAREKSTIEQIQTAVKSKRYTRTRLDRMLMCAFLGITDEMLHTPAPYTRVLAFNDRGRELLKEARRSGEFINAGTPTGHPFEALEYRCGALYSLFSPTPEPPDAEAKRRIVYIPM